MRKIQKNNSDELIVKGHQIIEASYRLSLQEQRIILYMAAQIKISDEDFKPIRIEISKFSELVNLKDKNYVYMQKITRELLDKSLTIKKSNSSLQISWLSSAEYFHEKGYVELCFDPKLKPYLLQLKERFTKYFLKHAVQFSHSYSIRFYELLKQYEAIGSRYFKIEELRWTLGIKPEEYKRYNDFKRYVLEPPKSEFKEKYKRQELDFIFDYREHKESRKVIGIYLYIEKTPIEQFIESETNNSQKTSNRELLNELLEMKLSKRQANNLIKKYAPDVIQRNIEFTKKKMVDGVIGNTPGFLIDAIRNDYAKDQYPENLGSPELRTEAIACWNKNKGSCRAKWSTYKGNKSKACHYCLRFKNQRNK